MPVKKVTTKSCCDNICSDKCNTSNKSCGNSACAVYGIGIFGAFIYFFQHATQATDYLMGLLKALVWPGILVYKALELLQF